MMYDPLNTGIGSLQGDMSYSEGLSGFPSLGFIGESPSPYSRPLPSEPGTAPYPSPFGPGTLNPYGGPFGGGTQGGIMDALNPHKRNLYSTYNPKKVDRFYKRVQQMSDRFFPGYAGGGGPEIIY